MEVINGNYSSNWTAASALMARDATDYVLGESVASESVSQ